MDFIEEYLRITARLESPGSYLYWGAVSCLSAVLRDNVYLVKPDLATRIYPNMYVLVIGDSAVTRKSPPFNINEMLLRGKGGVENTKVIAGASSIPALIKILAMSENGKPKGGSGYLIAREATSFFISDPKTIPDLTDLYDYKEVYDKHLATAEIPPIKDLCLSLFAGTNEALMKTLINQTAKEGGLIGRSIVLLETKRRQKYSGYEEDVQEKDEEIWKPLKMHLREISTVKGPITFSPEARKKMNDWYHGFDIEKYKTKTGFEGRIGTHIEKLAIVLSASKKGFNRVIQLEELETAIQRCEDLILTYKKLTTGTGSAPDAEFRSMIISTLLNAPNYTLERRDILWQLQGNITGAILDSIMQDFVDNGTVKMRLGGTPAFTLSEKMAALFTGDARIRTNHHKKGTTP